MAGNFIYGIESFPLPMHFGLGILNAYLGYL
jgi:hypothetical protein